MFKSSFWKWWCIIYILYLCSTYAGVLQNPLILYIGITFAFYIFIIKFPVFKKQPTEDANSGKEL